MAGLGPLGVPRGRVDPAAVRRRREQQQPGTTCSRRTCNGWWTSCGIEIRVAHYPPYCSKYNPIEHRLFPHVSRACQGVLFESVGLVKSLIQQVSTRTGLSVVAEAQEQVYRTKRKVAEGLKKGMRIAFDTLLPRWNYRVAPS